mgnify:CR=1 FL=1
MSSALDFAKKRWGNATGILIVQNGVGGGGGGVDGRGDKKKMKI